MRMIFSMNFLTQIGLIMRVKKRAIASKYGNKPIQFGDINAHVPVLAHNTKRFCRPPPDDHLIR